MMPLAEKSLLTDVQKVSNNFFVAVGERGHILLSDNGSDWRQASVPTQSMLTAVHFINETHGWAVGHDSLILFTSDGGASWQLQQFLPEDDKPLLDVYFRDARHGIAVGAYGLFYKTTDGGDTWEQALFIELAAEEDKEYLLDLQQTDPEIYRSELGSILPHFNRLFVDGNTLYMVGEAGFIAKSADFGDSWLRMEEFYNGSLFDLHRTPEMGLLAVGLRGHVFRSEDNGQTWQQVELSESATLNSVFSDAKGTVYLAGNSGTLLQSIDDGLTFTERSEPDGKAILNGVVLDNQMLLVTEVGIKVLNLDKSE
ncbi:WD40/YVTN/BNR-like repeat-containing protein [Arsukibacterium tuosuense]|nr:YCF48-related protein [Arsukibacterium tuosuense]